MSGKIMGAVYELALTHAQRDVLLALADHADDDGTRVYPSHARIAWKLDCSVRTVERRIGELLDAGILKQVRHSGRGRTNEYRIDLSAGVLKAPFIEENEETPAIAVSGVDTVSPAKTRTTPAIAVSGVDTVSPAKTDRTPAKTRTTPAIAVSETPAIAVSYQPSVKSSSSEPSIESSSSSATTDDDDLALTLTWLASECPRLKPMQLTVLASLVAKFPAGHRLQWCMAGVATLPADPDAHYRWLLKVFTNAVKDGKCPGTNPPGNGNGKNGHTAPALADAAALKAYYTPAEYAGIVEY